ncbi:MAG TPA: hypothetical protein VGR35_07290 [Tepidisphaeraceae bacterium]|nr:hypothetical protein [Tepidisphaeraceae bacterium]
MRQKLFNLMAAASLALCLATLVLCALTLGDFQYAKWAGANHQVNLYSWSGRMGLVGTVEAELRRATGRPDGARPGDGPLRLEPGVSVNATTIWTDGEHTLTITTGQSGDADAKPERKLVAKDKDGKVLFEGPIDTPEARQKIPAAVGDKLRRMESARSAPLGDRPGHGGIPNGGAPHGGFGGTSGSVPGGAGTERR